MAIFYHVVEAASFSGAARKLGIAKSAVSRHVSLLEKNIGARLLNRSTRSLSLTEVGESYFLSCARIVTEAETASRRVSQLQDEPLGTLRVAGPQSLASQLVLGPMVKQFIQRYPALNIELLLDDRVVDMVSEGIDVSIREGWLPDSNLVARKLVDLPIMLCASPEYIACNGAPESPSELMGHEGIIFTLFPSPSHWTFKHNNHSERIQIKSRLKTNSVIAMRSLLLSGAGIASLPSYQVLEDIKAGRLVHLLPKYDCGSAGIYAVYQDRQYQQARVRLFIDFMARQLRAIVSD